MWSMGSSVFYSWSVHFEGHAMMIGRLLLLGALLLASAATPATAQVEAGVHGSLNPSLVSGEATLGIGGRAGGYLFTTGEVDWKVEGVFDYFFAGCPGFSCWAWWGPAGRWPRPAVACADGPPGLAVTRTMT